MMLSKSSRVSRSLPTRLGTGHRPLSSWHNIKLLQIPTTETFRSSAFEPELPVKITADLVNIDVRKPWFSSQGASLNIDLLRPYGDCCLPMELTVPGTDTFHRAESAPLSMFLDSIETAKDCPAEAPRIYIAQCPLKLLPRELAEPFHMPEVFLQAGKGDVYDSSLWLGLPPTSTPLHRDPNPNLFAQVAGEKVIRILSPERGSALYTRLREGSTGAGFGADERIRGEEMMKGEEKNALEHAIWSDLDGELDGFEARLGPGEALFIPLGWWHAVRGIGADINMSVNWWFR